MDKKGAKNVNNHSTGSESLLATGIKRKVTVTIKKKKKKGFLFSKAQINETLKTIQYKNKRNFKNREFLQEFFLMLH